MVSGLNLIENKMANPVWWQSAIGRRRKIAFIAPEHNPTVTKADHWLHIRPGTDSALMLGAAAGSPAQGYPACRHVVARAGVSARPSRERRGKPPLQRRVFAAGLPGSPPGPYSPPTRLGPTCGM